MLAIPVTTELEVTAATAAVRVIRARLVTLVTPEIMALLVMVVLEVMQVTPVIQAVPATRGVEALVDQAVLAGLIVQVLGAPVVEAVLAAVMAILELQVTQVQVQQQVHQETPAVLDQLVRLAIPEQVEVVLPVEIRVMQVAVELLAVQATQVRRVQEET